MAEILNYLGISGFAFIFLTTFIEITPIKFSPLQWIGRRLFANTDKRLDAIEAKIDTHIVQSYRSNILNFQNECIRGQRHSQEQFRVVIKACDEYEAYIEENNLKNGEVTQAMEYIRRTYQKTLANKDFIDIQNM